MELDSVNLSTDDLDNLHLHWQDYNIFPKACNIQMVFYEPMHGQKDILVKVLLNEHEATLPVHACHGPYYRWSDLKQPTTRENSTRSSTGVWSKKVPQFAALFLDDITVGLGVSDGWLINGLVAVGDRGSP